MQNHLISLLRTKLRLSLVAVCLLTSVQLSYAHNKVVVIPLGGDEASPLEPWAPVAKVNPSQTDYTIGTSTVVDKITKLEWQRIDDDVIRTWNDAFDYCASLELDGRTDWRLPDVTELLSIVDYGQAVAPVIEGVAFPGTDAALYWTSTIRSSKSTNPWAVTFSNGNVTPANIINSYLARCAR